MKNKNIKDLENMFEINEHSIRVDKNFINKNKLTLFDIKEIMRLIESIKNGLHDSTINEKVANIFKKYNINIVAVGIGWEV